MRELRLLRLSAALIGLTLAPALASAQATIAGLVTDASGAVLPGVTVEAASPALIERVRTAVTDGSGQYRIEQLRPGPYTVTFMLQGFATLRREGIDVTGSATVTVNGELRVGAIEETVTVTGAAPTVDLQSTGQERVLTRELLDALPFGRTPQTAALFAPGVSTLNTFGVTEIGGTNIIMTGGGVTGIHGSLSSDSRVYIDGLTTSAMQGAGQFINFMVNNGTAQEVTLNYGSFSAEHAFGGVQTNVIPREGGNRFSGSLFGTFVNSRLQGSNYAQELSDRGLRTPNSIKHTYDVNPSFGGPLKRDHIWFFASARWVANVNYVAGMFYNRNAGDPAAWTYEPDLDRPAASDATHPSRSFRLTWQATARNKLSVYYDNQVRCQCPNPTPQISPEASSPGVAGNTKYKPLDMFSLAWTSPFSSRVLFEVRSGLRREYHTFDDEKYPFLNLINVVEQGGIIPGLSYRGGGLGAGQQAYLDTETMSWNTVGSMSYVTGTHSMKVGLSNVWARRASFWRPRRGDMIEEMSHYVSYRFNNGVPNQITLRATPFEAEDQRLMRQPWDLGLYAQDTWTITRRLTLNGGIRFQHYANYAPEIHVGPGPLVPTRNITFPRTEILSFNDVVPRLGAAYDLFGTGKTAVKVAAGKYLQSLGLNVGTMNGAIDPASGLTLFTTRSWNDANRDYFPDCDLANPLANGECGTVANTNFGRPVVGTTSDPDTVDGWGKRPYQWEYSASLEREISPRVSASAGYFRRSFGNFTVVDNLALSASDFDVFTVVAPNDPRLPDGGGQVVGPLYNRKPETLTIPAENRVRFASNYGKQTQIWSGIDLTFSARAIYGVTVQGGLSTGRTESDTCEVREQIPEIALLNPYCFQRTTFLTDVKLQSAYTIPRVDVQLGLAVRSSPGPQINANRVVPNAEARQSLGRDLSGGAANVTVNMVTPGTLYGDRYNQVDFRTGKVLRLGGVRTVASLDVYNVLNSNPVLSENAAYRDATISGWRIPTAILPARFVKFSLQLDF